MLDPAAFYYSMFKAPPAGLERWLNDLPQQLQAVYSTHGEVNAWCRLLASLPDIRPSELNFNFPQIKIGRPEECDEANRRQLESCLRRLHPWRKGPFEVFGIWIDSEWRCDLKWQRLAEELTPLHERLVLDVGAGNGYYGWRMLGAGAARVIGIDPTLRYVFQFHAIKRLAGDHPLDLLPLALEDLPSGLQAFDTVFSMGVLYHRRSPFDHLYALKECLRPGGELVLETLVIEGKEGEVLVPEGRYAQMRNVWFIPSPSTLEVWLKRAGYRHIRCIDISVTMVEERRSTGGMAFQSVADFLDPYNHTLTVEGLPAPRRAIFLAEKP